MVCGHFSVSQNNNDSSYITCVFSYFPESFKPRESLHFWYDHIIMCCFQHLTQFCFCVASSLVKNGHIFPVCVPFGMLHCHGQNLWSVVVSCELKCFRIYSDETCCMLQFKKPEWAKTVISYSTDKAMRLPVVDVAVRDVGAENQSFWLEIGPVCYTWCP